MESNVKPVQRLLEREKSRRRALAGSQVVPDAERCVQCGICSYHCPIGIDVRGYVWRDEAVSDSRCIACGECVARCPRGVLRFRACLL